jgi:hypothetical protein
VLNALARDCVSHGDTIGGQRLGVGVRSIRSFQFGHFDSVYSVFGNFGFWKSEDRSFKKNNRNQTRIDRLFRFGLFGPPNYPNCHRYP